MNNLKLNRVTVVLRQAAILIDRWHWVLLVLAAPFLLFPSPQRSPAMLVVPASWLLHWLVVGWEQRAASRQGNAAGHGEHSALRPPPSAFPLTPLNATLLLMFCMVLVSLWATVSLNSKRVTLSLAAGRVLPMLR